MPVGRQHLRIPPPAYPAVQSNAKPVPSRRTTRAGLPKGRTLRLLSPRSERSREEDVRESQHSGKPTQEHQLLFSSSTPCPIYPSLDNARALLSGYDRREESARDHQFPAPRWKRRATNPLEEGTVTTQLVSLVRDDPTRPENAPQCSWTPGGLQGTRETRVQRLSHGVEAAWTFTGG